LDRVGLDFTIMGEDEWCCGYPLLVAGMGHYIHPLKEHNLKKVEEIGAKRIIFTCPSCYHTWKNEYRVEIDVLHHTEFMLELIDEGKIKLRQIPCKVTYHDPCDLGRNSLIYQAPREVITSIPGVEFVEMRWSKEYALCCGGGGDLEVVDAKIPTEIGRKVIEQAKETGAEILVTSCQQCKRTLNSARGDGIEVVDVAELVMKAMG
jgi:heterodisulfide reductase subunit D